MLRENWSLTELRAAAMDPREGTCTGSTFTAVVPVFALVLPRARVGSGRVGPNMRFIWGMPNAAVSYPPIRPRYAPMAAVAATGQDAPYFLAAASMFCCTVFGMGSEARNARGAGAAVRAAREVSGCSSTVAPSPAVQYS